MALPMAFVLRASGQFLGDDVEHRHASLQVGGDHGVADAAQRDGEAFLLGGEILARARMQVGHRLHALLLVVQAPEVHLVRVVDERDRYQDEEDDAPLARRDATSVASETTPAVRK